MKTLIYLQILFSIIAIVSCDWINFYSSRWFGNTYIGGCALPDRTLPLKSEFVGNIRQECFSTGWTYKLRCKLTPKEDYCYSSGSDMEQDCCVANRMCSRKGGKLDRICNY